MKRRLFWKILVGFWLTFILIGLGIGLAFSLLRPDPEISYMRGFARMSVTAAASAVRLGGTHAFETELPNLAVGLAQPRTSPAPICAGRVPPPFFSQTVSAPDGTAYRVSYYPESRNHSLLGVPIEVVLSVVVGGLGFSAVLAWYLTQPIQRMKEGFDQLAGGDFTTWLGPAMGRRRDEIASLAHDFDIMAMRLAELVGARDRLLADVSHELRTPLARLNLAIGLARQDPAKLESSLDRISGEAAKLDEMVGELLTLAKLESGQHRSEDYFNFAEIVKTVVQDARYEAAAKGVEVRLDIKPVAENFEWIARGSGKLVSRAVENIVRNAVRYSSEGGKVVAELGHDNAGFHLLVSDEGPGVPEEAMAALFKPFVQSADGFGFGLGLAIAQRAMVVHGGSIAARNRKPKGLEMAVTLPAANL